MRFLLQKMYYNTNDKTDRNRLLCVKLGCILIVAFLFACLPINTVQAASGIRLYNYATKKETTYTGKQVNVTYNGKKISVDKTPGILVDGYSLVSYQDIFVKSGIDMDYQYIKSKGTVTLSMNGTTIKFALNSKKAVVNGKTVSISVAPVMMKYVSANVAKILVPSRFVAETFGLNYTWHSDTNTVEIVKKSIRLSYNGASPFEYKGTKGSVTIDNKKVYLDSMPSIILNNTAMLRAKRVFADSSLDVDYSYKSSDKSVTLSKDGNKLEMTIGSKIAYLNGKKLTLSQGPILAKNYDNGYSYVLVPGSATATYLGYNYSWDKYNNTSNITTKKQEDDTDNSNTEPELGDDGVVLDPGTVLNQWQSDPVISGMSTGIHELNTTIPSTQTGIIYSVARDYNNTKLNTETFVITADTPFEKVTSGISNQVITIQAANKMCTDQLYQLYGVSSNYVNTIGTNYNTTDLSSIITLNVVPQYVTYDLSLSEDKKCLYVTVYLNNLSTAVVGTNSMGDYLRIIGTDIKNMVITKQDKYMYLDFPYTTNALGNLNTNITGAKYLKYMYTINSADNTRIILELNDGYEYYISEEGNQGTISFITPGSTQQPETPSENDFSNYEIVIPKPDGISDNMITHADYYHYNKFSIKIPGDHTAYFASHPVAENSDVITNVSVSLNSNNETEIKFTTSRLQGYEFDTDSKNIYVHIGEPRDIYKNIVVLDPGHGGPANGAEYFGTKEKNVNYKILYQVGEKFFNSDPWKLKVYYTRITDVDMTLTNRAYFADKVGADLFVSLHMNASTASSAHGTEVYYAEHNNSPNSAGLTSKTMATLFVNNITKSMGTQNRGAKAERYTVVYKNTVPAVLIELGFLSNQGDYALITDSTFQEQAVQVIYNTLLQIFDKYPTGR